MSLNLERKQAAERRAEKEKERGPKREVKTEDIVIFRTPYDEQKWRLSKLMEDPVTITVLRSIAAGRLLCCSYVSLFIC